MEAKECKKKHKKKGKKKNGEGLGSFKTWVTSGTRYINLANRVMNWSWLLGQC